jgi:hypothetical protein
MSATKSQGFPCPICQTVIKIELEALLSNTAFTCPNAECHTVLKLDQAQSKSALDSARKLQEGLAEAERRKPS